MERAQLPKTSKAYKKRPELEKALLPDVTRFFKPIYGDDYSEYLCLPPKLAATMKHMVGQEAHLQDSTGKKWPITISYVDGVLAFHKGWNDFFSGHRLSIGQIMMFEHINGSSCFSVRIYGIDACEILNFDQEIAEDGGEERSSQSNTIEVVSQGNVGTIENDVGLLYCLYFFMVYYYSFGDTIIIIFIYSLYI
ncbi:hypothetical protein F511_04892 [Dorcoceras hygrometricum]|uniref:TF-B3 domain-containing protein n=1 Tax=Dorcoceras hygrometricum TaxID=472368 RepID=A0A2Z7BMV0_9LAMI|nr:hypothetical protein F511_04892 [Dorcoceras hygrometricum]